MRKITIKGTAYNVGLGMELFAILGEKWKYKTLNQVQDRIALAFQSFTPKKKGADPVLGFEELKVMRELFFAMIDTFNKDFPLSDFELMDYLMFEDTEAMASLSNIYSNAQPQNTEPDPNVRKAKQKN